MIKILPKDVADKIAAGEVVDRPASIVKELLENAIDAGADTITVEIRNGGKTYIRVADNGCGIPKDEVATAFLRHATSKVQRAEDLSHVTTLGFRGEALASIAAVSRTEMITKPAGMSAGVSVRIEGGEITCMTDTGCPDGTTIVVSDLFYNTPARLKFMKTDATESTRIISLVSRMALAYPGIKIRMISNGTILFYTAGKGNIHANIIGIFGKEIGEKLIRYNAGEDDSGRSDIELFISPQDQTRSSRKHQVFFVNRRYVTSKLMENAVMQACKGRIPEGRFPVVFLFYRADPAQLDVNIHPNKKEVRFSDEKKVYELIVRTVTRALDMVRIMPEIKIREIETDSSFDVPTFFAEKRAREFQKQKTEVQIEYREAADTSGKIEDQADPYESGAAVQNEKTERGQAKAPGYPEIANIQISGAIFDTYIVGHDTKYFYLIDQHAAHERIFYERLLEQFHRTEKAYQTIMEPVILEIPVSAAENADTMAGYLQKYGFEITPFGPRLYKVSSIPSHMNLREAEEFLKDFIEMAGENTNFTDKKSLERVVTSACKKAVKAHDSLSLPEMKHLLADLAKTTNPFSCPHGRPVFLKLGKQEIERMFRRS